jgi:hypothetical protein
MASVGDSLMVEQRTLTPLVKVRVLVPQPFKIKRLAPFPPKTVPDVDNSCP